MKNDGFPGSGQTDFGPQLKSMNKQLFTIVAWDPRGYGQSIPPSRDFPPDFFERDAKDAVDLMQVNIKPIFLKFCRWKSAAKYVLWFNSSRQLSSTQLIAHSPLMGWEKESER